MKRIIGGCRLLQSVLLLCVGMLYCQSSIAQAVLKQVTGEVADPDGRPVPGAVVSSKGVRTVVTTNDGKFVLNNIDENAMVRISHVGFDLVELHLKPGQTQLKVRLSRRVSSLTEVVVNTGLYKRPVGNFTGAASSMSGDELKMVNPVSTIKAIAVLDPSFRITEDNVRGSDPNNLPVIQMRGTNNLPVTLQGTQSALPTSVSQGDIMSSYTANPNQPLIIIDGFQSTLQALVDLDINRIERITLLKDAAATVAYGSRAANGVVVVETKKPVSGRLQVSYSVSGNLSAPDLTSYHLLDAKGLLQAQQLAGIYTDPNKAQSNTIGLGQWYDERLANVQRGVNTDWLAQPVRMGFGTNHTLALSGGTNNVRFALNLSYNNNEGVMKGSSRNMYTLNNLFTYNGGKFKLSDNTTVSYQLSNNSPWGAYSSYAKQFPYFSPYDSTGNVARILEASPAALGIPVSAPGGTFVNAMYNSTLNVKDYTNYLMFTNAVNMDYAILPSLRLTGGVNIINQLPGAEQYYPAMHTSFVGAFVTGTGDLGSYTQTRGRNTVFDSRIGLDFNKRWGYHTLFVSVGGTAQSTSSNSTTVVTNGIPNDNLDQLGMANGYSITNVKPSEAMSKTRSMSMYASVSYNYHERYTVEATTNASGSSQFGSNNRIAPFFAYGAGWNIDKERFFNPTWFMSTLRLRASYGITGNQNFSAFLGQPIYQYNTTNNYRLQLGSYLQGYANPDLKWQQTNKWNIGFQTGMFGNRVNINGNYFIESTNNLVLPLGIEPSTGFSTYQANLGSTVNKGYEVSMTAFLVKDTRRNLFWSVTFNTSHYTNMIKSLSPAIQAYNAANNNSKLNSQSTPLPLYAVGQSMTKIWAVPSLGIDPATGNEVYRKLDGSTTFLWDPADKRPVGDATSKLKGAFGSNLLYKGFVLNVMMSYEWGGQQYNQTLVDLVEGVNLLTSNADSRVLTDRWKQPGDHASFKRLSANGTQTNATSRFVQDNNYIDASSITVGYNFPSTMGWIRRAHLSTPRLFITQNEVFRLSTIKMERGTGYPFARNFSLGLSTSF